jgi:outer membrane receptor protein involved in Fe transport
MAKRAFGKTVLAAAMLASTAPVAAQQAQPATPTPPPQNGTTTPTPAPNATAPTPAPGESQLPPVQVIQKQEKTPATEPKKTAAKKTPVTPPPVAPAASTAAVTAQVPGTGGIDDGSVLMSPVEGSAIPIGKYPGAVGRASAADIARSNITYVPDIIQQTVPAAILEDLQGNGFQQNLQYRGFDSSPLNGVPQGLAVYQNGVRINESFGDIVNWDFLPESAIEGITVVGANPVFGLNALGGAVTILMRDGFSFQGTEIDVRGGSFGRVQGEIATGQRSGNWATFFSFEGIRDDGWREFSPANVRRGYADIGAKDDKTEVHLNFTAADISFGATTAAPVQLLGLERSDSFTSPQVTTNRMTMVSLNGQVKATPTLTFSGVSYYRWFQQVHADANLADVVGCPDPGGGGGTVVCFGDDPASADPVIGPGGITEPFDPDASYGTLDHTSQNANSYGASGQGVEKTTIMGMHNQFLLGASYDHGRVGYASSSDLGTFGPEFVLTTIDPTFLILSPDDSQPRNLTTQNDYVGVYFSDTLDITSQLSWTVGGRYNFARISLLDNTGTAPEIDGVHIYERFNPMTGVTYQFNKELSAYGGYAEANRAPTPAELGCSDPVNPCLIENFLTSDPNLQQVVSRTFEAGLRGKETFWNDGKLEWSAGLYHAMSFNDILPLAAPESGRGFFANVGDTLRQGIELGMRYTDKKVMAYANYALVDATLQTNVQLPAPNNPTFVPCDNAPDARCANVTKGDRLPGIPEHLFKTGMEYWFTPQIKGGFDVVAASNQIFYNDWANTNAPLAGYATVNIHGSYDVTKNFQIYGLVNNLLNAHYGLFGNYFNLDNANGAAAAAGLGSNFFTNPETVVPGAPISAYGGVKIRF